MYQILQQAIMQNRGPTTQAGGHSILRMTQDARSPTRLFFIGCISQGPSHNGVIYPLMTHVVPCHGLRTVINEAICIGWQSASRGSPPRSLNESFQPTVWNARRTLAHPHPACRKVRHVDCRCSPPWKELWFLMFLNENHTIKYRSLRESPLCSDRFWSAEPSWQALFCWIMQIRIHPFVIVT